jgi:4-hydroxy-2-oxoheptanedioate aldolase
MKQKKIFGTWMVSGSSFSAHLIAESNLDFAVIDLEHGHFNTNEIPTIIKLLHAKSKLAGIRTSSHSKSEILNCMDAGPDILLIPSVNNVNDVEVINDSVLYYPEGLRGASGCTHANGFSRENFLDFKKRVNQEITIGYMIETADALIDLPKMAAKMRVNSIVYFGTYDLAESLGIDDPYSSSILKKIEKAVNDVSLVRNDIDFGMVLSGLGDDKIPDFISFLPIFGDAGLYLRGLNDALMKYDA